MKISTLLADLWRSITKQDKLISHYVAILGASINDRATVILWADSKEDLIEYCIENAIPGTVLWKGYTAWEFLALKRYTYRLYKDQDGSWSFD